MVAGCLRRVGRLEDALLQYREVGGRRPCQGCGPQPACCGACWCGTPTAPLPRRAPCLLSGPTAGVPPGSNQHGGAALLLPAEPGKLQAVVQQFIACTSMLGCRQTQPAALASCDPMPVNGRFHTAASTAGVWAAGGRCQVQLGNGTAGAHGGGSGGSTRACRASGRAHHGAAAAHQRRARRTAAHPPPSHRCLPNGGPAAAAGIRCVCCGGHGAASHARGMTSRIEPSGCCNMCSCGRLGSVKQRMKSEQGKQKRNGAGRS